MASHGISQQMELFKLKLIHHPFQETGKGINIYRNTGFIKREDWDYDTVLYFQVNDQAGEIFY